MPSGERIRGFILADLAVSRKMASAAQVGAALARFLEDGGSLLGELAKLADLSDEQIRRLESEAETRASEGAALFSDRYCDFDLIGAGGMGIVYLALDTQLNRKVAVKIVRPPTTPHSETPNPTQIDPPGAGSTHEASYDELVDRFMQEAWLTGALEHPGIVPVYELGRTSRGVPYYTMRFVKGVRTLQGELGKAKTLNDRLVLLDPFLKICDAVRYAHSRGVIHRDLKPENIGLGEFGEVVVLDWGLAKMRDIPDRMESVWQQRIRELRETHDLKTAASALGTPGYMSPEAALGDFSHVDERSDVYSLGVVLHQILTGRLPFEFENYPELLHKLREESPQPASEIDRAIPVDLSRICAKALSREKPERFAGAGLLASAIRDYQHESAVRSEVRGLIQEAQAAFEGTKNLEGETLLRQLDRVMALCQRVLQHRTEHTRARQLLKECGARRKRAMEDREQAIEQEAHEKRIALIRRERERRERLFSRVALVGLMVIAIGAAVVAWILDAKRKEAQTAHESVLQTRGELGDAKTSQDRAERSAREASAEVARLRRALSSERTSTRAAKTEAARLHTELQAERSATRVARTEEKRVKAERDQVLVERDAARKNLDDANGEIANLRAALEAVTKAKREAEQRAEAERRAKERAIESAAARAGTQMTPPTESASEPHWSADQMQRLVALARQYTQKTLIDDKDEILAQARKVGCIPRSMLKAVVSNLFEVARSGPKCEGKTRFTTNYPPFETKVELRKAGDNKGILIGLPKQGRNKVEGAAARFWAPALGRHLIGVFPWAPGEVGWSDIRKMDETLLGILRELKRTYDIDTNRIYLAGYEDSGGAAIVMGSFLADVFAAVSANRGLVPHGGAARFTANLYGTPIFLTHFDGEGGVEGFRKLVGVLEDLRRRHPKGYACQYLEGKGGRRAKRVDHMRMVPGAGVTQVVRWLLTHERDPYPKKVIWNPLAVPGMTPKRTFFWLRKAHPSGEETIARISGNRIELQCSDMEGLSILLADAMFDSTQPVSVVVNGETKYEGRPELDPAALVESILDNVDPEQVFTYRIDL